MESKQHSLILSLLFWLGSTQAFGHNVLLPGFEANVLTMQGLIESRHGAASFYNPANLTLNQGTVVDVNLGVIAASYQYKPFNPQVAAAGTSLTSPTTEVSLLHRWNENWSLGGSFIPRGTGDELEIKQAPLQIGTSVVPFDVRQSTLAFSSSLGVGYKWNNAWRFGISLLLDQASNTIAAAQNGQDILSAKYSGTFFNILLGGRTLIWQDLVTLAWAIKPLHQRSYQGDVTLSLGGQSATQSFHAQEVDPLYFCLAASTSFTNGWQVIGSFGFEDYRSGRSGYNFTNEDPPNDFKWSPLYAIGTRYRLQQGWELYSAFNYQATHLGDGAVLENPDNGSLTVTKTGGGVFGDFRSLDYFRLSLGARGTLWDNNLGAFYSFQQGTREVTAGKQSPGEYELLMHILGVNWTRKI